MTLFDLPILIPYRMKTITEFILVTLLRMVIYMELNISKLCVLKRHLSNPSMKGLKDPNNNYNFNLAALKFSEIMIS